MRGWSGRGGGEVLGGMIEVEGERWCGWNTLPLSTRFLKEKQQAKHFRKHITHLSDIRDAAEFQNELSGSPNTS